MSVHCLNQDAERAEALDTARGIKIAALLAPLAWAVVIGAVLLVIKAVMVLVAAIAGVL